LTSLSAANSTTPVGSGSLAYNNTNGTFTYTPPALDGYASTSSLATVATSGSYNDLTSKPSTLLASRNTAAATTASINDSQADNITIVGFKSYMLLKVQTSAAAWVVFYTDSTSRSNDAGRSETTDPTPGSGVLAEVVTTGAQTILMTPSVMGFNNDGTPSSNIYAKVVNKSGATQTITVTLTLLQLEA
jgi:hypothetical protein